MLDPQPAIIPLLFDLIPNDAYSTLHCTWTLSPSPINHSNASSLKSLATVSRWTSRPNEVKIDRATSGLVLADGSSWLPLGFYETYSSSEQFTSLMHGMAPYGFNSPIPYRSAFPDAGYLRFMDAMHAMRAKVHFDMHSLAQSPPSAAKTAAVAEQVLLLRDHPALLAYYIADEPDGDGEGMDPAVLLQVYRQIKALDPRHPVTLVLNCWRNPFHSIRSYAAACDVVMSDPYCIGLQQPVGCDQCSGAPVDAGRRALRFLDATNHSMPFWLVPQAFGGPDEHWARLPNPPEESAMYFLSAIAGARGWTAFLEGIPYNSLFAALQALNARLSAVAPALLLGARAPASLRFSARDPAALEPYHAAFLESAHGASAPAWLTLLVANPSLEPLTFRLSSPLLTPGARVLSVFEERWVVVDEEGKSEAGRGGRDETAAGGSLADVLPGLGVYAYRLQLSDDVVAVSPGNLLLNPSFETHHITALPDGYWPTGAGQAGVNGSSLLPYAFDAVHGYYSYLLNQAVPGTPTGFVIYHNAFLYVGTRYALSLWSRLLSTDPASCQSVLSVTSQNEKVCTVSIEVAPTPVWALYSASVLPVSNGRCSLLVSINSNCPILIDLIQLESIEKSH